MPFGYGERIRRTICATWLELLAEGDLLFAEALGAMHCRPAWRRVAAAQEFLIDVFVAGAAVARGEMIADDEAVMVDLILACGGRVAIEAGYVLPSMG